MLVHITYRGQRHELQLENDAKLAALQQRIQDETSIPVHLQKLVPGRAPPAAGKVGSASPIKLQDADRQRTLEELGLRDGHKIMVLGVTQQELQSVKQQELEANARAQPRRLHDSLTKGAGPRITNTPSRPFFHNIHAHPNFPASTPEATARAKAYLERLANDPGVIHVMSRHAYSVGILTELLPHEHPNLLGLNENMGARISLRIRTDRYDGFRDYTTSRRVLMHELAHNEVNDHPPEFKELNSQLNKELARFERDQREGARHLTDAETYDPGSSRGSELGMFGQTREEEQREEMRLRILNATEKRLAEQDAEIEVGCGNGGPHVAAKSSTKTT